MRRETGVRSPKDFFEPLAVGAPIPLRAIPPTASRMIHFFDPSSSKMVAKLPGMIGKADVLLGNLEDAVEVDRKDDARRSLVQLAHSLDFGSTSLWSRVNALHSQWALADFTELITQAGEKIEVLMIPKVEGPEDIHYVDRLVAQLEAQVGLTRPILIHAILETARGVANVEEICIASPRMQGISLGPADLAADRQMKTTNVGGGHPGYLVRADPVNGDYSGERATAQQDLWHYTVARMVDACRMAGIYPYYGPFGEIKDVQACEDQFRNAYVMGCVGAWSLHPSQIEIARRVFTPDAEAVRWAQRVVEALPDGAGTAMVDGKFQDDASYKLCQAVLQFAGLVAERDGASTT
jgi:malyl-CoA/(S)-citramalyl-CoA lyase